MRLALICFIALLVASSCFFFNFKSIRQNLEGKCCVSCTLPAIKYYVIRNDKCGESCIDPQDYEKIKRFEPGLTKADSNTPCPERTFTNYYTTETHGAGSLKI